MKKNITHLKIVVLVFVTSLFALVGRADAQSNVVVNGDFSSGELSPWSTFLADWEGVQADFTVANNKVIIENIVTNGAQSWFVQLNQEFSAAQLFQLTEGNMYRIGFTVEVPEARPLNVFLGQNAEPFTALALKTFQLEPGVSNHEIIFEFTEKFDLMKLGFEMGLSNVSLYLSDISLREAPGAAPGRDPAPVMEDNFILFVAGGRHITIPGLQQGVIVTEPQVSDKRVLQFNYGN